MEWKEYESLFFALSHLADVDEIILQAKRRVTSINNVKSRKPFLHLEVDQWRMPVSDEKNGTSVERIIQSFDVIHAFCLILRGI